MNRLMDNSVIESIVNEYGSPSYIYDRSLMVDNASALKDALYPGATLCYAMKANPLLGVCEIFQKEGLGIEVASMGELNVAIKAGYKPSEITFTSPGKTIAELEYAIGQGLKIINIDSLAEAAIVDMVAKKLNKIVTVGIRINPAVCYSNAKIKMSGVSSQFGVEEEDLNEEFFDKLRSFSNLNTVGIQIYMGTQMLNYEDIVKNTEYAINLGLKLCDEYGIDLKLLNCGGGFGVKYFKNENELDMAQLKAGMQDLYDRYFDKLDGVELVFESGRFLMATTGVMVTKVLYVKESKGQRYLICDGGSNIHSSAAFLGRFVRNNFPLHTISKEDNLIETTICGPLCTALDVIGQKVMISNAVAPGDLVVIEQSGAYGYTYSLNKFLSHETPAEILIDGEDIRVLRQRGSWDEFLVGQNSING